MLEAEKAISVLMKQTSKMHSLIHEAATKLSELSSTNERLLAWLETELGLSDLLAAEQDEWARIRGERAWIESAWQSLLTSASADANSGVLAGKVLDD